MAVFESHKKARFIVPLIVFGKRKLSDGLQTHS